MKVYELIDKSNSWNYYIYWICDISFNSVTLNFSEIFPIGIIPVFWSSPFYKEIEPPRELICIAKLYGAIR